MTRPLYDHGLQDAQREDDGHSGLWYDRFFDCYPEDWQPHRNVASKAEWAGAKAAWIGSAAGEVGNQHACEVAVRRIANLCSSLRGVTRDFAATWHFATGLGNPHPVENGFLWHPTLGTPYIAGSAVKGLVRAWVEAWMDFPGKDEQEQQSHRLATIYRWFGSEDKDPTRRKELRAGAFTPQARGHDIDTEAGAFIFFDALPVAPVTLKTDVMTPHMDKWYEKGGKIKSPQESDRIPADWHNPVPVFFLVADKPTFQFAVAPRTEMAQCEVQQVMAALGEALEWLGVGAKTAVGYGSMVNLPRAGLPDPLAEFQAWFKAHRFSAANKGQHREVIEKLETLPDVRAGKAIVRASMKKGDCANRLWLFLHDDDRPSSGQADVEKR